MGESVRQGRSVQRGRIELTRDTLDAVTAWVFGIGDCAIGLVSPIDRGLAIRIVQEGYPDVIVREGDTVICHDTDDSSVFSVIEASP